MQPVDNDTFFEQLAALFESTKVKGSVWLTHKRLTYNGGDAQIKIEGEEDAKEYPCLVRATDGVKKFSTLVEPGRLDAFHEKYGALLKASMTTLRKRDKKREKQKAEERARIKKQLAEPVDITGPKRGRGRRQRQRRVKAAVKREEKLKKMKEREEARAKSKEA